MTSLKHIIPLAALALFSSCEKEIDFQYHDIPEQLVIEGLLTQRGASVKLTRTVATDEPFSVTTVTDATVSVIDLTSDSAISLSVDSAGVFASSALCGVPGHDYRLNVRLGDDTYTSSSRMLPPVEILSAEFNWIRMPYDDVAVLKVQFTEDSDPQTYYWMRVYRNGEVYEWQTVSSHSAVDGVVDTMMLTSRKDIDEEDDDEVLKEGDVVDIEVMPVSRTMADYLTSLNNGDYNGDRMFTGSFCLGYFLAAPVSTTRLIYHPSQIPYWE